MSLAIWPLAAQNVSLYLLAPGGIKCFIVPFCPWRYKMFHYLPITMSLSYLTLFHV